MTAAIENQLCIIQLDSLYNAAVSAQKTDDMEAKNMFKIKYRDLDVIKEKYMSSFIIMQSKAAKSIDTSELHEKMESFMDKYYSIKVFYENCFGSQQPNQGPKKEKEQFQKDNFQLPKITIPTFAGSVAQWSNFKSVFNSLIHDNESLTPVHKMHYLITSLTGDAANLIKHLPICEQNYLVAYELLMKRFDNKRLIADTHLEIIINLPQLQLKFNNQMRKFLDTLKENLHALDALGMPVAQWSFILLHILLKKLDTQLRNFFELHVKDVDMPKVDHFIDFIESRCKAIESASLSTPQNSYQRDGSNKATPKLGYASVVSKACVCCETEGHELFSCQGFINMSPHARKEFAKTKRLCFNCLRPHTFNQCTSKFVCKVCKGFHHTLLHLPRLDNNNTQQGNSTQYGNSTQHGNSTQYGNSTHGYSNQQGNTSQNGNSTNKGNTSSAKAQGQGSPEVSAHSSTFQSDNYQNVTVLLATALIHIRNGYGQWSEVRALIDSGSQCSFITTSCAKRLRLSIKEDSFSVSALGGQQMQRTDGWISCDIKPRFSDEPIFRATAGVLQRLTNDLPSHPISGDITKYFEGMVLADPDFHKKQRIDFLLGADMYDEILTGGSIVRVRPGLPAAMPTKLGYLLSGRTLMDGFSINNFTCNHVSLEQTMSRFWEIEELPSKGINKFSDDDALCEDHFLSTYKRDETGRYTVQLPFKREASSLGETKDMAIRRFYSLERRLGKDPLLKEMYCLFLKEYEELGHMTPIHNPQIDPASYIIPHHGVLRPTSSSTKLRVVFDASAASSTGVSLNNVLLSGPKLQQNIVDIITRFRVHLVVFTADIKQMYRQIGVQEIHRPYQRILWRSNETEPVKEYQLNTVTYGITSAPFLAMRSLRKLAEDKLEETSSKGQLERACSVVLQDIFVDDVVSGAATLQNALDLKDNLVSLLKSGCFELRKWCSNSKEFLASLPKEHCEVPLEFNIDGDSVMKILGLKWNSKDDSFLYNANIDTNTYTKRSFLSNISRLYDPCGWLAPVVFMAKSMMQKLWLLQIGWDETPPVEFIKEWKQFSETFSSLREISIPRFILYGSARDFQLHAFSDASEKGYAGVVYLRVTDNTGCTKVFLLAAKSKVAPIKQRLTIPKLELNGALLAATLTVHIKNVLSEIPISSTHIWCDSSIVLSWLRTSPHSLRMYEGNRVSQIHSLIDPSVWRYVPTKLNPADAASRGLFPNQLVDHPLWWNVPWLMADPEGWPRQNVVEKDDSSKNLEPPAKSTKIKKKAECYVGAHTDETLIYRYSSLSRLLRITCHCIRFIQNCRSKIKGSKDFISAKELDHAMKIWIKEVQQTSFHEEMKVITSKKNCLKSKLFRLSPFIDSEGLLRVGGRLKESSLPYDAIHPILLPRNHHFTNLVIDSYHLKYLHVGPSTLLSLLRQKFWILSGRQVIRQRVFKCMQCFRHRPKSTEPVMADLPSGRVQPSKAFSSVAADFAGPFFIKESNLRKARIQKAYLCIFVCFSTKACHLESVSDLSADAFLAAFQRFVSRRGLCRNIYTDNGTNFQGANNNLKEVYKYFSQKDNFNYINSHLATNKVQWHFSPASAPHFNGLAESAVKSAKYHVLRVVGEQRLTFEELSTLFCRVEAVLNSRPLSPISSDPHDFQPLTPGHFLIGCPLTSVPEHDLSDISLNRLSRWQLVQKMSQGFWNKWSHDYLHNLQQRNKWNRPQRDFQINDLVIIREDNVPPLKWKLGRVLTVHPGKDSVVRAVTVKTQNGTLVRPAVKLCLLPQ